MPDKPRLSTLELTGWRKYLRLSLFLVIAGSALLAVLGYVLPAHRAVHVPDSGAWLDLSSQPGETHFHSNFADGGPLPILVLMVAASVAVFLRKQRFGVGFAAAVLGGGAAFLAAAAVVLAHMFSRQESSVGDPLFYLSLLLLFGSSCALLISEPLVHILEKRRLIRASLPAPLPKAVAMSVG